MHKCRGSKEHYGFWPFFYRYQKFQSKNESQRASTEEEGQLVCTLSVLFSQSFIIDGNKSKSSGKFGLPTQYDKSYRINFVIKPPQKDRTKGKGKIYTCRNKQNFKR